jgi:phosphatidylserine/phosphatidylglycerophosphate/cardiolipin synthase-like enzyme
VSIDEHADLSSVPTAALELLRQQIKSQSLRVPLVRADLIAAGIKHHLDALETALSGHSAMACVAILDVALAERRRAIRPDPELVWTGPERSHATARDTAVVLRSLFESAQEQVILAGFTFERGASVLRPLHEAMTKRKLDVRFFIHVQQVERGDVDGESHCEAQVARFRQDTWPYGDPVPRIYYDRRATRVGPPWSSLHAKCVVVDGRDAFVGSANFSVRAQEQNIEAGVLLKDATFAHHLSRQWMGLIEAGLVIEAK